MYAFDEEQDRAAHWLRHRRLVAFLRPFDPVGSPTFGTDGVLRPRTQSTLEEYQNALTTFAAKYGQEAAKAVLAE
jgi:hypothetical protein